MIRLLRLCTALLFATQCQAPLLFPCRLLHPDLFCFTRFTSPARSQIWHHDRQATCETWWTKCGPRRRRAFEDASLVRVARSALSPDSAPVPLSPQKDTTQAPGLSKPITTSDPISLPSDQSTQKAHFSVAPGAGTLSSPADSLWRQEQQTQTPASTVSSGTAFQSLTSRITTSVPSSDAVDLNLTSPGSNESLTGVEDTSTRPSSTNSFSTNGSQATTRSEDGDATRSRESTASDETATHGNGGPDDGPDERTQTTALTVTTRQAGANPTQDAGKVINSPVTALTPSEATEMSTSTSNMSEISSVSPGSDPGDNTTLATTMTAYESSTPASEETAEQTLAPSSPTADPVTEAAATSTGSEDTSTRAGTGVSAFTDAANRSKEETPLSFVIDADYKQLLNESVKRETLREIRRQLSTVLKVPARRIVRLTAEPGSIIVRFSLIGPRVVVVPRVRTFVTLVTRRRFFIILWRRRCFLQRPVCVPCTNFPVNCPNPQFYR